MRTRFDQFAKQMLAACLSEAGVVETERETSAEPQAVDIWFVPHEGRARRRFAVERRAVLGSMTRTASLIEAFHRTPGTAEILKCVAK
jgi:hypothetical protein